MRKIGNKTNNNKIHNYVFRRQLAAESILDKLVQEQVRWFGHVSRMNERVNGIQWKKSRQKLMERSKEDAKKNMIRRIKGKCKEKRRQVE